MDSAHPDVPVIKPEPGSPTWRNAEKEGGGVLFVNIKEEHLECSKKADQHPEPHISVVKLEPGTLVDVKEEYQEYSTNTGPHLGAVKQEPRSPNCSNNEKNRDSMLYIDIKPKNLKYFLNADHHAVFDGKRDPECSAKAGGMVYIDVKQETEDCSLNTDQNTEPYFSVVKPDTGAPALYDRTCQGGELSCIDIDISLSDVKQECLLNADRLSGITIQKKCQNKRDCFLKELTAQREKTSQKLKKVHFDSLLFLVPSLQTRETSGNTATLSTN